MTSQKLRRESLWVVRQMNPGADREMAAEMIPQRINGRCAGPNEIGLEALVASIEQRDTAARHAAFWKRAFFILAWIASTASAALVLAWMKGGLNR